MLIPLFVILVFGVVTCVTGPAFDDHWANRRRRLDFPKVKLLAAAPCKVCQRRHCPYT
jgi:hypothetical protein